MGRKKKRKQSAYEDYDEYDSYDIEESENEDEDECEYEEDDDDVKSDLGHASMYSPVRTLGRRKKRGKLRSSFVRPDAKPVGSRHASYSTSRRNAQHKRGPHFAMASAQMPLKYTRPTTSIFAAWGKLLMLIFVLAIGTWMAFFLSSERTVHQNSVKENHIPNRDFSASEHQDEAQVPEIVQKSKNVTSNTKTKNENPSFYLTSARSLPESEDSSKFFLQQLENLSPMKEISGGKFKIGDDRAKHNDQKPAHLVSISHFMMDIHPVTNRQFQLFVNATGYQTTAEKQGWSYVFDQEQKKWIKKENTYWKNPQGHDSWSDELWDHPVTHVSYEDAMAFCQWSGKKLPTEAQWEYAARGDRVDRRYPWGSELIPNGRWMGNFWQGWFPDENTVADGYLLTSPVCSYPENPFGLFDLGGNVWEWCHDWYAESYYQLSAAENPEGPSKGEIRVLRGGSFLSAENQDAGYSVSFRFFLAPQLSRSDVGFRCVKDSI